MSNSKIQGRRNDQGGTQSASQCCQFIQRQNRPFRLGSFALFCLFLSPSFFTFLRFAFLNWNESAREFVSLYGFSFHEVLEAEKNKDELERNPPPLPPQLCFSLQKRRYEEGIMCLGFLSVVAFLLPESVCVFVKEGTGVAGLLGTA